MLGTGSSDFTTVRHSFKEIRMTASTVAHGLFSPRNARRLLHGRLAPDSRRQHASGDHDFLLGSALHRRTDRPFRPRSSAFIYSLPDANWNVVALYDPAADAAPAPVERYAYTPYGVPLFLAADFTPLSGNVSAYAWETLYCGYATTPPPGCTSSGTARFRRPSAAGCPMIRWETRQSPGAVTATAVATRAEQLIPAGSKSHGTTPRTPLPSFLVISI